MLKQRSDQAFLLFQGAIDLLITAACWLAAYALRWETDVVAPVRGEVPPFWWCVRSLPTVLVAAGLSYYVTGLYQLGRRWPLWRETIRIGQATAAMLLIVLATGFYTQNPYASRLVTILFWLMTTSGLLVSRRLFGLFFRWRRRLGSSSAKALIVGTGRLARTVERSLRSNNWVALEPIGFVDDPISSCHRSPTVGGIDDLPELIERHQVSYVFVALPLDRYADTKRIFKQLSNSLVEVRIVPDIPSLASLSVQVTELEGIPMLKLRASPHGFGDIVLKRAMDVVLASVGLIVLSPLFALIALLIKWNDRGPVFYFQERMGLNGHRFRMVKFRSMKVDAETTSGPVWASATDERRTRLGTFLRATSIDELPQLWNVVVGDMSLVGPRPERPYFIENFRSSIPQYMLRHAVKAGITGWAQVNGWRGNTSLRKRVQYDLYYIANWSIWLDFRILVLTVFRVLFDKNAY